MLMVSPLPRSPLHIIELCEIVIQEGQNIMEVCLIV